MSEPLRGPAAIFEQMWQSSEKECVSLCDEIERLRECLKGSDMLAHVRGEQIERLRAALEEIAQHSNMHTQRIARRALEGK